MVSLLGGSRLQSAGPTAAFLPIVLLMVTEHGCSGLLMATMAVGVILTLRGAFQFGALIKFIAWPVTSGFTTWIAIKIMLTQISDFFGVRADELMPREFFEKIRWLFEFAGTSDPLT